MAQKSVKEIQEALESFEGNSVLVTMTLIRGLVLKTMRHAAATPTQAACLGLLREASLQGYLCSDDVPGASAKERAELKATLGRLVDIEATVTIEGEDNSVPTTETGDQRKGGTESEALAPSHRIHMANRILEGGHSDEDHFQVWVPALHKMLDSVARTEPTDRALQSAKFATRLLVPVPPNKVFDDILNEDLLGDVLIGMRGRAGMHTTRSRSIWKSLFELLLPFNGPKSQDTLERWAKS